MRALMDGTGLVLVHHRCTEETQLDLDKAKALRLDLDRAIQQAEAIACTTCRGSQLVTMAGRLRRCTDCGGTGRKPGVDGRGAEG